LNGEAKLKTIKYIFFFVLMGIMVGACSTTSSTDTKNDYYTQLGVGYLQKGRLDLAVLNLEKALEQSPDSADTHHYYALLQEQLKNDDKAAIHFRKALSIDPKNPDLLNNYGSFLCRTGHYPEAEALFMASVRDPLYKTPEFAYTNAGICVHKNGDAAKAESYFHNALQVNDHFPDALYQMAKLNHEKGDNAKAQAFLYRYNDVAPASPEVLLLCYQVQTQMQETEQAEACASQLQAKFPESTAASQIN
jgi:type IV pilus assembly protein PilF